MRAHYRAMGVIVCCVLALSAATSSLAITPDNPGGGSVQFTIDSAANVKEISPWIYGANGADYSIPIATFDRSGGNRMTGYNWENNASNAGADWYHHSDYGLASGPNDPPGTAVREMILNAAAFGRASMITVPMAGYVAADGNGTVDETEIAPSPRWKEVVAKKSTIYPGSPLSTSPNKTDGYVFTDEFVNWAESYKDPGQPVFYSLDNEVGLWGETLPQGWQSGEEPRPWENPPVPAVPPTSGGRTHPTIHPYNPSFDELRVKTIAHAGAIKDVNPDALVFGGVGYGWTDFTNLSGAPDAVTNPSHPDDPLDPDDGDESGEMHYHEWLLQQVADAEEAQGRKLMDVLDLHWYTEVYADGQRITGDIATPAAVEARVQAPRSLWDPTYVEESWISKWGTGTGNPGDPTPGPIRLLPRVQRDIDDFGSDVPGPLGDKTKIAITEYNYGGNNHISGAIAEADFLGIMGREGVFAANIWGGGDYIDAAFEMFLNYDGTGGSFGDTSIEADTSSIAESAVYASVDDGDPNRMIIVAINRTGEEITTGIAVTHDRIFDYAEVYQLTSDNPDPDDPGAQAAADIQINLLNAFQYTMPAWSVSTLVLISDGLTGDYNGDGKVSAADFTVWQDSFGAETLLNRDPDNTGPVGIDDFESWKTHYGEGTFGSGAGSGISASSVPEPVSAYILVSGGMLILLRRRRPIE